MRIDDTMTHTELARELLDGLALELERIRTLKPEDDTVSAAICRTAAAAVENAVLRAKDKV